MGHQVEIDGDALAAERSQLERMAGPVALPPPADKEAGDQSQGQSGGGEEERDYFQEWKDAIEVGLIIFHGEVMPEWEITDKGRELIATGGARYAMKYFPEGPVGIDLDKLPPYVQIAVGAAMIAWANFDRETLRLKPMKPEPPKEEPPKGETYDYEPPRNEQPPKREQTEGEKIAEFPG